MPLFCYFILIIITEKTLEKQRERNIKKMQNLGRIDTISDLHGLYIFVWLIFIKFGIIYKLLYFVTKEKCNEQFFWYVSQNEIYKPLGINA